MALLSRAACVALACAPLVAHADEPAPPVEPPSEPTEPTEPEKPAPPQTEPAPPTAPDEIPLDQDDGAKAKKKKKKPDITYDDNHWLVFHGPHKKKLRFRLYLEPMLRFGHVTVIPDWTTDLFIRRGRIGFDATIQKHTGVRFELSVKNNHSEIHNMYAWWKPQKGLELQFGFIKPPGGLERDTFSFEQPFIERSVMTFLNKDHEVGIKVTGKTDDKRWRWAAAITRDPPPLEGGDPEDSPVIPANVESEDIFRAVSKWNTQARFIHTPCDAYEVSIRSALRFRPDEADFGEIAVEPYDSTFLTNRPWHGTWWSTSADFATAQPHWRLLAEGGFRRDGPQLEYPDGDISSEREVNGKRLTSVDGYVVLGFTPNGTYGPAVDAAPLKSGWEIVTRVQGARIKPVDQGPAWMYMVEGGVHIEVSPNIRLQTDFAIEKFGKNDNTLFNENLGATRYWIQEWAVFRL